MLPSQEIRTFFRHLIYFYNFYDFINSTCLKVLTLLPKITSLNKTAKTDNLNVTLFPKTIFSCYKERARKNALREKSFLKSSSWNSSVILYVYCYSFRFFVSFYSLRRSVGYVVKVIAKRNAVHNANSTKLGSGSY